MNNIADQQDVIFYDLLINYFMNNPALYDKMEENYAITVEKLEKLLILSSYLKELDITKSGKYQIDYYFFFIYIC